MTTLGELMEFWSNMLRKHMDWKTRAMCRRVSRAHWLADRDFVYPAWMAKACEEDGMLLRFLDKYRLYFLAMPDEPIVVKYSNNTMFNWRQPDHDVWLKFEYQQVAEGIHRGAWYLCYNKDAIGVIASYLHDPVSSLCDLINREKLVFR